MGFRAEPSEFLDSRASSCPSGHETPWERGRPRPPGTLSGGVDASVRPALPGNSRSESARANAPHRSGGARAAALLVCTLLLGACGSSPAGDPVRFTVPEGSGFGGVADTLSSREIIQWPSVFRLYARFRGVARDVKPGVYEMQRGLAWSEILDKLVSGDIVQMTLVVPEGWTLAQIAPRIAEATDASADSIYAALLSEEAAERYGVPGPTLEGYLYPATYILPFGITASLVVDRMVGRYKQVWTPERRALADSLEMSENEIVALASIVEKEARQWGERDTIAAVYHNRLGIGMALQADPTVQYALGEHHERLLYSHIDEVADHPYNTYRRAGLPPGPIASPSTGAIDATLNPAEVSFLYFVARPDGSHIFTRSLAEHNNARAQVARMRREAAASAGETPAGER
ncbi:MAG: endolytic transglycosylase MltG [Gemmatimonas sp.]|nr:endolytic transglycosylase MltG [Gemmatimonas sp.]